MDSDKLRPYTIQEIAEKMGLSEYGAKAWIRTFMPDLYPDGIRKNFFTAGQYRRIINEFNRDTEKK